jgi:hypothetical protein
MGKYTSPARPPFWGERSISCYSFRTKYKEGNEKKRKMWEKKRAKKKSRGELES